MNFSIQINMEKGNSLKSNLFRALSANAIVAVVGFLGSFIFPRILSIDDYALYHTFTLYLTYITIMHLGFPSGMAVNYAGTNFELIDKKQYKSELLILGIIISIGSLIMLVIGLLIGNQMLLFVSCAVFPVGVIGSYKSLLQSWNRFKEFSRLSSLLSVSIPLLALTYYVLSNSLPADIYILIYLVINWIVTLYIVFKNTSFVKGVSHQKLLSKINFSTEKTGLALVVGNYINTLFVAVDKQFVKLFFGNQQFAFYSFAMSMQAIMTVFITSIAQPLFPAMAAGKFDEKEYNDIKELLIIFGSLSGLAYFAVTIIIKLFIPKYIDSLDVVGIYFVVFPAMAVINCLYINLYKIKRMMPCYIKTLTCVLCVAVILNAIAVRFYPDYTGVSIATTITYCIWFFVGFKQFNFLNFTIRDGGYLFLYVLGFYLITRNINEYIGIPVYMLFILILILAFYRKSIKRVLNLVLRRNSDFAK